MAHFLDLPDEILIMVFKHLQGVVPFEAPTYQLWRSGSHIPNIRLTCTRFNAASSYLLIDIIHIQFDSASLSRLKRISDDPKFPEFRKGVRAIRIHLDFYDPTLASNIERFAAYSASNLREIIALKLRSLSFDATTQEELALSIENADKVKTILDSWEHYPFDHPDDTDLNYQTLRRGHEEYQRRFAEQEEVQRDGAFVHAVATAIAKMPHAEILQFREGEWPWRYTRAQQNYLVEEAVGKAIHESLFQRMLVPHGWEDARKYQLGSPLTEMLVKLPVAIHKAGTSFTTLTIEVAPPENFYTLAQSEDLDDLTAAVQKLKKFTFKLEITEMSESYSFDNKPSEAGDLKKFLGAVVNTESIQELYIDVEALCDNEAHLAPPPELDYIINKRPWQELSSVTLVGFWLDLAELTELLDQRRLQRPDVKLREIRLIDGAWADCLDLLREKAARASVLFPWGAECEDLEWADEVYLMFYDETTEANVYMSGADLPNPIRELQLSRVSDEDSTNESNDAD